MPKRCCRRSNRKRNRRRKRLARWSFIGYRESIFGKHSPVSHKEMWRLYRIGVISDNSPIMAEKDVKFHKVAEWKELLQGLLPFSFNLKSYEQTERIMNGQTGKIDSQFLPFLPKVGPQVPLISAEHTAFLHEQLDLDEPLNWEENSADRSIADCDVMERPSRRRSSRRTYSAQFEGSLPSVDEETDEEVADSFIDSMDDLNETLPVEIGESSSSWNSSSPDSRASTANDFFRVESNERRSVSRGTDAMDPMENMEDKSVNTEPMVVSRRRRYASSSSDGSLFSEGSLDSLDFEELQFR